MPYLAAMVSITCFSRPIISSGAALPLAILYGAYNWLIGRLLSRFDLMSSMMGMLPSTQEVFYYLLPVSLVLGIGIGLTGSIITVRKHVEV